MKSVAQILPALLRKQPRRALATSRLAPALGAGPPVPGPGLAHPGRASALAAPAASGFGNADEQFAEDLIRSAWNHLAGRRLAARTRPLRIYRGKLVVEVPESSWARQLRSFEGALLDRVNRLLGERRISDVEWHVNAALEAPVDSTSRKPPRREVRRPDDDRTLDAAAAQAIRNPELRELFLRTVKKMAKSS